MDPFKPFQPRRPVIPPPVFTQEEAEILAIRVVAFISADEALLSRFVALTGCGAEALRAGIGNPGFLGSVLDFLLADEAAVLEFSEQAGLHPEAALRARARLP